MNFIDRLILLFSPQRAYEREAWRQSYEELRYYDAGPGGRTLRGTPTSHSPSFVPIGEMWSARVTPCRL